MDRSMEEYKRLIDELVTRRPSIKARLAREGMLYRTPTPEQARYNNFLAELSPEQLELVADLIQEGRDSGIHDTLVVLTDGGYRLSRDGVALVFEPFGTEIYFDFIARLASQPWPEEEDQNR